MKSTFLQVFILLLVALQMAVVIRTHNLGFFAWQAPRLSLLCSTKQSLQAKLLTSQDARTMEWSRLEGIIWDHPVQVLCFKLGHLEHTAQDHMPGTTGNNPAPSYWHTSSAPLHPSALAGIAAALCLIRACAATLGLGKDQSLWKQSGLVPHLGGNLGALCLKKKNIYNFLLCFVLSLLSKPLPRAKEKQVSWNELFARIASIALYWTNFKLKKNTLKKLSTEISFWKPDWIGNVLGKSCLPTAVRKYWRRVWSTKIWDVRLIKVLQHYILQRYMCLWSRESMPGSDILHRPWRAQGLTEIGSLWDRVFY